jgi:tRNA-2-methylthio-N6-dimethylallyladenosine synthase
MTDHIVVFEGNERLIGETVDVVIDDASSFTLFGNVLTDEIVGAACTDLTMAVERAPHRIALPMI